MVLKKEKEAPRLKLKSQKKKAGLSGNMTRNATEF